MAYNNRNVLKRMVKIQDIVLEHKRRGVSQLYVYQNIVEPTFHISYSTFNRYLAYPAKLALKNDRRQEEDKRQLSLF